MVLGISLDTFTVIHVAISLVALVTGLVLLLRLLGGSYSPSLAGIFLVTTILTSVTGFMFPGSGAITPAQIFGGVSLVVLAVALVALIAGRAEGRAGTVYIVASVLALYLNAFVAVVQAFQKLGPLRGLAPTQSEWPFLAAQIAVLIAFAGAGYVAAHRWKSVRTE